VVDAPSPFAARFLGAARTFDARSTVGPIDLEVARGKTTVLLGPSGCGKTTLLRMLIGLAKPDDGRVEVLGEALDEERLPSVRRRMGYLIQEGGLFPHLSARQNVCLLAQHVGRDPAFIDAQVERLSTLARLDPQLLQKLPSELSGGQRQRVALVRALMLEPELLLLDEPLGALDPMVRVELQEDLRAAFRTLETSVVMVTHDLAEAAFFADTLVLLHEGKIAQRGSLDDLERTPASPFVERFLSAHRPARRREVTP
jgi:osmoprotectant transport system ATP-binding protein